MKSDKVRQIYLRAWGNAWILYTVNPVTGTHSFERMAQPYRDEPPIYGFASMEPMFGLVGRIYAVYALDGRVYFQAGRRKWDITDVEVRTDFHCAFGVSVHRDSRSGLGGSRLIVGRLPRARLKAGGLLPFGFASRFRLLLNGKVVHKVILVHPMRAVWPFLDPTYDSLDFESDHFLYFLSRNLISADWREHMLSMDSRS